MKTVSTNEGDKSTMGRPPTDPKTVALVESLLESGVKPEDIKEKTGLSLASVYLFRRLWLVRKGAPQSEASA